MPTRKKTNSDPTVSADPTLIEVLPAVGRLPDLVGTVDVASHDITVRDAADDMIEMRLKGATRAAAA